ncbi:MAG: pseudouridine synthase [Gemmatimonadetes bacterium]|nr:pseudouridine synthase [Gemmatimonadota bacterium]
MRLQRALARAGVASRRASENLITAGRVHVNGVVADLGMSVDPGRDTITVGGRRVRPVRTAWILLNKPVGHVVSRRDAQRRPTVFELVPDVPGLTYVGRLDVLTGGLLLLTNDGDAVHRLTHPRFGVERTYRVLVRGRSLQWIREALRRPIPVDGRPVNVIRHRVRSGPGSAMQLTLVLGEGRNRIVRRLCEALGLAVEQLARVSHGPIQLGRLAPGAWRYLTNDEIRSLRAAGSVCTNARANGPRR